MSLATELAKMQERKEALLKEVALIDRELEQAAMALGVKLRAQTPSGLTPIVAGKRVPKGAGWPQILFWLRSQSTAKSVSEITAGTMLSYQSVNKHLARNGKQLIHRGTRWGTSESQFADHSAALEEERRGDETAHATTPPTAPSLNGPTDTLSALTTTASTPQVATETAASCERD